MGPSALLGRCRRGMSVAAACCAVVAAAVAATTGVLALPGSAARADPATCWAYVPPDPGVPPWGFSTYPSSYGVASYARAVGNINLATRWISGTICQDNFPPHAPDRVIIMHPLSPILYHSHDAFLWGYEGNLIVTRVRVTKSFDPRCKVGTVGRMTMFASYNGVRSDSIHIVFPAACRDHDRMYHHGADVNAQVPPL